MLFDSALRKELGRNFGATLVVLITIVMTVILIRTLGQASMGRVNPSEVMLVMGYTVLGHLPTILTLSLFVAITSALTRMYANSEMVVWFTSGQALSVFIKPLFRFAWPICLGVAVLALLVWPWSNKQILELRDRYQGRGDIERVAPGQFIESAGGQRVFFIDKDASTEQRGSNIFIMTKNADAETVTSAKSGQLRVIDGARFLVLNNGHRLEIQLNTGRLRLSHFVEYRHRLSLKVVGPTTNDSPRMKTTMTLLQEATPSNIAELSWRLGLTLATINCVIIALAATRVNPRVGRSASLIFTLFAFAGYYNLISVGESWIRHQYVGLFSVLLMHVCIFMLALFWLLSRQNDWLALRRTRRLVRTAGSCA